MVEVGPKPPSWYEIIHYTHGVEGRVRQFRRVRMAMNYPRHSGEPDREWIEYHEDD